MLDHLPVNHARATLAHLEKLEAASREPLLEPEPVSGGDIDPVEAARRDRLRVILGGTLTVTEVSTYLHAPLCGMADDPLSWWKSRAVSFPFLSKLAKVTA